MEYAISLGFIAIAVLGNTSAAAQAHPSMQVALIKMPYSGARNVTEISDVPEYLARGGIETHLTSLGATLVPMIEIRLTAEDEKEYGSWHRMGLANGHLASVVSGNLREHKLSVGLLANCTSLIGVLGGLQNATPERQRIGLVFIDSHGDFNVPETTLSGMLGGMPVAVAAGMALTRLREESGLAEPIPTEHIIMAGVRDLDPLERDLFEASDLRTLTVDDIRTVSDRLHAEMRRLSELTDVIYVHIDMDVLDPAEVSGHPLTVPDGPTSHELAAAVEAMFGYEKTVAFGVASTPANERDPDGLSRQAAYRLIEAAVRGSAQR